MTNTAARATLSVGILAAVAGTLAYLFMGERGEARREAVRDWAERTKEQAKERFSEAKDAMEGNREFEFRTGKKRIHVGYETE